jgi:pimeloyl-ACP methyl ester carboxylesterase
MPEFTSDGVSLAYETFGEGPPVLLIHGFASSIEINWVATGWVDTLTKAGYGVVAIDNRGHGKSQKLYDPELYWAHLMADDAARLLDHLGMERASVIGYSMGARIIAYLALRHSEKVACAVLGGIGYSLVTGLENSEAIIEGLLAERLEDLTHPSARQFRAFADHSRADRKALAACMETSREPMPEADVRRIATPSLVAVGENDDMVGSPQPLLDLLPNAEGFTIPRRNHMLATGDPRFKAATLAFLGRHFPAGRKM